MTQNEINTLKNLLLKVIVEIDDMDENEVIDTFSEFYDKDEITGIVGNVLDCIVDDMPVKDMEE